MSSASLMRRCLRAMASPMTARVSRAYVPGPRVEDAMQWARRAERMGVAVTLGHFNADDAAPTDVMQAHLEAIAALSTLQRNPYLSVKWPALCADPGCLERVARRAQEHGLRLHFDSHGPEHAEATLQAAAHYGASGVRIGVTLPGRWRRSMDDLEWAIDHQARIRIVKGQWACDEMPELDPVEGCMNVVRRLAGRAGEVAIATHDAELARLALRHLRRGGTHCELEILPGMPRRQVMAVAREMHVPVRVYIPFGAAWMPYALRHLVTHPRLWLRLLHDGVGGQFGRA